MDVTTCGRADLQESDGENSAALRSVDSTSTLPLGFGRDAAQSDVNGNEVVTSTVRSRSSPYGEYRVTPTADLTDKGFTGHAQNDEVALIYMRARYYVPGVGRFARADTIVPNPSSSGSYNRYTYAAGNPLRFTDPTGHYIFEDTPHPTMGGHPYLNPAAFFVSPKLSPTGEAMVTHNEAIWYQPRQHDPLKQIRPALNTIQDSATGSELSNLVGDRHTLVTFGPYGNFAFSSWWIHLQRVLTNSSVMRGESFASLVAHELVHVLQRAAADSNDSYYEWGRGTLQMEVEANIVRNAIRYELTGKNQYLAAIGELTTLDVDQAYTTITRQSPVYKSALYSPGATSPNPWAANLLALGFSQNTISRIQSYANAGRKISHK